MNQKASGNPRPFCYKKSFKAYSLFLLSSPFHLYRSMTAKDFWSLLFLSCLALYVPVLWVACALFVCYKIFSQVQQNNIEEQESIQCIVVQSVEFNRLQVLSDAIEANPDILYCVYQRRSLVAWCRYYKNTRALELILQMMEKYPNTNKVEMAA